MNSPQVHSLTAAQIRAAYAHFEHGKTAPKGVRLDPRGFTHTMGRTFVSDAKGTREVILD